MSSSAKTGTAARSNPRRAELPENNRKEIMRSEGSSKDYGQLLLTVKSRIARRSMKL
jgi:hypothetical protein